MSLKNAARPIRFDDRNLLFYDKVWQPLAALYNENCSDLASHLSTHQTFMKYVLHNNICCRCSWFQHRIRPLPEGQYEEMWLQQGEYWWGQASLYCIYLFLSSPAKINKYSCWWNHDIMLTRPVIAPHTAQPGVLVCPPLSMNVVFHWVNLPSNLFANFISFQMKRVYYVRHWAMITRPVLDQELKTS